MRGIERRNFGHTAYRVCTLGLVLQSILKLDEWTSAVGVSCLDA